MTSAQPLPPLTEAARGRFEFARPSAGGGHAQSGGALWLGAAAGAAGLFVLAEFLPPPGWLCALSLCRG